MAGTLEHKENGQETKSELTPELILKEMGTDQFLREFHALDAERQHRLRRAMYRFLTLTRKEGSVIEMPEEYKGKPYALLTTYRNGWRLDLSSVTPENFVNESLRRLLGQSKRDIEKYGDNALAHLCLSTGAYFQLLRNGVETIRELQQSMETGHFDTLGIGLKRREKIVLALTNLQELKREFGE